MEFAPPAKVTEKTRLKHEACHLKRQISKAKALLKQRQTVKDLHARLSILKDEIEHPDR